MCEGCRYWKPLRGGRADTLHCCHYALETGHLRGDAEPCPVRQEGAAQEPETRNVINAFGNRRVIKKEHK